MGTWGSSLYANDTTRDVRDTYMNFLQDQLGNQEAYEKTLERCDDYIKDSCEAPLFWYALADTQWRVGRLLPNVKSTALHWIDRDGGISLWEENKNGGIGWRKTLDKLRIKLESEQPKEKKIRKPVVINQNPWDVGDVYAYRFHTEVAEKHGALGKFMILQKMGEAPPSLRDRGKVSAIMRVHVFDRLFDEVPTLENIKGIRLLPLHSGIPQKDYILEFLYMSSWLHLHKNKDYPADHLTYIGNITPPANTRRGYEYWSEGTWSRIEGWSEFFKCWQGVDYKEVGEGVFKYIHQAKG